MQAISNQTAILFLYRLQLFLSPILSRRKTWLFAVIWFLLIAPAHAAMEVRVAIEQGIRQIRVGSSTPAIIRDASGAVLGQLPAMEARSASKARNGVSLDRWNSSLLWIEPKQSGAVFIGDRWYRGRTLLVNQSHGLAAINYVDLEQYLYSVVGSEMPASWNIEALKAQAVAARSYVVNKQLTSRNPLFDVQSTVASQVYKGMSNETVSTQKAVLDTAGQVLQYQGKVINAVFHSSSGGHTENVEEVWSGYLPYLRGVPDYDNNAPNARWATILSNQFISQRIGGIGSVRSISPERLTQTGRLMTVKVVGTQGQKILDADKFRMLLGLKSTWLTLTPFYGSVAATTPVQTLPASFQILGRGFGHGIGMSQWGANTMAQQGYKYDQILSHYYQGTTLTSMP